MQSSSHSQHSAIRAEWLASRTEDVIDPSLPIVDAHHHIYDRPGVRYLLDELLADINTGHNVRATVYVQARSMLRASGPEAMKPVGETEFANGIAAASASGQYGDVRLCDGIVGAADLLLGTKVGPVLEAHMAVGGGRFRGIRHMAAWDPDRALLNPAYLATEDMLDTHEFRLGFAKLAPFGLSFDAWVYFHQIARLTALARAFPQTAIVLNHCGGILGIGTYAGRHDEVFRTWSKALRDLAQCPNVMVKLGGLGMRMSGLSFENQARAPSSLELASKWRPWMETCLGLFGASRCMFESNFPVDKGAYSYRIGWNAMKRVAENASREEREDLFWRSASRFYRLQSIPQSSDLRRVQSSPSLTA
jgi:L-fuconolactonase